MYFPRSRHSDDLIPGATFFLDSAIRPAGLLLDLRNHVLKTLRTFCRDLIASTHNPCTERIVSPIQSHLFIFVVDSSFEHTKHFRGMATASEYNEEMSWRIPAAT